MTWSIRWVKAPALHDLKAESEWYRGTVDFDKMSIGDLCFYHYKGKPLLDREQLDKLHLTACYFANNAGRAPLILALPDKAHPNGKIYFLVDGQCYSGKCLTCGHGRRKCTCGENYKPRGYHDGWTVTGTPPMITVQPSVNYDDDEEGVKHYHGFVTNGVIGDG